jgi:hypothetical protein
MHSRGNKTEQEYVRQIRAQIRTHGRVMPENFDLLNIAFINYLNSPALWCLRGDMIQLSDDTSMFSLDIELGGGESAMEGLKNVLEQFQQEGQ